MAAAACSIARLPMPNPWHDVPPGADAPAILNAIVEIPQGSKAKYELDKDTGLLRLDRVLFSAVVYPANYGFVPRTLGDDGDPLDILVLSQVDFVPLALVQAKVIGAMRLLDQGEHDDKIIAIAKDDVSVQHYDDISQLPQHLLLELGNFFEDYKKLEHKTVAVDAFSSKAEALEIVRHALALYQNAREKR
jgi:inorganic pyrophosphatase